MSDVSNFKNLQNDAIYKLIFGTTLI